MSISNTHDGLLQAIGQELLKDIKARLEDILVQEATAAIIEKVRADIKPIIESITIKNIEQYRNIMNLREELVVKVLIDETTYKNKR